jgi:hypothetical protein
MDAGEVRNDSLLEAVQSGWRCSGSMGNCADICQGNPGAIILIFAKDINLNGRGRDCRSRFEHNIGRDTGGGCNIIESYNPEPLTNSVASQDIVLTARSGKVGIDSAISIIIRCEIVIVEKNSYLAG